VVIDYYYALQLSEKNAAYYNKIAELSQRRPRDAPYMGALKVPDYAHGMQWNGMATIPEIFNGLLFRSIL